MAAYVAGVDGRGELRGSLVANSQVARVRRAGRAATFADRLRVASSHRALLSAIEQTRSSQAAHVTFAPPAAAAALVAAICDHHCVQPECARFKR